MKNFFKNTQVKVNHRITLAVLLTLIGLAFVSYSIINEKLSVLKADRALNHLASLGVHANDLVHELQVERGLSAIFLGSKGKKHKKELKVQRVQTHKARKVFENELASLSPEDKELTSDLFDQKVKIAQSFLQNIESIQKRIDSHKASSTVSFGYYTDMIKLLFDITTEIAVISPDAEISKAIVPYVSLIEANEAIAQERGLGAGELARGKFSHASLNKMQNLLGQQKAFHQDFLAYATPTHRSFFNQILQSADVEELNEMRRKIHNEGLNKASDKVTPEFWFEAMTHHLKTMGKLEKLLAQNVLDVSKKVQEKALSELVGTTSIISFFVLVLLFFVYTIRSLTSPMLRFAREMFKLSQGNLDVKIPFKNRKDELGMMAQAMNDFRQHIIERDKIIKELEISRQKAEAANKAKSGFLATMSHEIRTPMNGVLSCANLLLDNAQKPENIRLLKTIQSCGDSLLTLINDILDFSKVESGKLELEEQPFDLVYNTKEVIDLLSNRASEKGITMTYKVDESVPQWIHGDVTRFRQILINLTGNAIKFTQKKVHLHISSKDLQNDQFEILCSIKDDGIGISKEGQSRLFKSFSQVDASTTRKFGGTGLGLAICKGLTSAMGGKIWVESEEGKGSNFQFTISVKKAAPVQQEKKKKISEVNPNMGHEHPLKILMAEDNSVNQMVGRKVLSKLGYRVDIASNGLEAVNMSKEHNYDLILMDQHMPEMDGIEATQTICKNFPLEERPRIVALTASAFQEDRQRCIDAGMSGFLTKPIAIECLVEELFLCESRHGAPAKVAGLIDPDFIAQQFEGATEIIPEIAEQSLDLFPQYLDEIQTAIESKDGKALEKSAHTLKGLIANFGVTSIIEVSLSLEILGKKRSFRQAPEKLSLLKNLILQLQPELEELAKRQMAA